MGIFVPILAPVVVPIVTLGVRDISEWDFNRTRFCLNRVTECEFQLVCTVAHRAGHVDGHWECIGIPGMHNYPFGNAVS